MKTLFKTTIISGLFLSSLFFSCKKQDGYSDEVNTTENQVGSSQSATDSTATDNAGPAANNDVSGSGNKNTANSGAQSINAGTKEAENGEVKGRGTGTGPGPSPKDGAAYSGPSDPQNLKADTTKTKAKKKK
ncbi:hypothetical protein [Flavobacterium sp.]|uniref:hypothetical protein n=1 Tax=Flavobacterium sp. TaxID=239 RepID=UPI00374D702A